MPKSLKSNDEFLLILLWLWLGLLKEGIADRFIISPTIYFYNLDKIIEQVVKKFCCQVASRSNSR